MIGAILAGATGLQSNQSLLDATANNVANVNTTAFKRGRVEFQDLLYLTLRAATGDPSAGLQSPTASQVGTGVAVATADKVFTPGQLLATERELDVAIEGEGFLRVALPDGGIRYTRDGAFVRDANGLLRTGGGLALQPPITIPANATAVSIGADGTVLASVPGQPAPQQLGQLTLAKFRNQMGLSAEGNNLFAETPSSGPPLVGNPGQNGTGPLRQGFLEGSNVEVVSELTNLLLAQRAFTFNSEVIRVSSEMLRSTSDLLR